MPQITYEFVAAGPEQVRAAFRSIGQEAVLQGALAENAFRREGAAAKKAKEEIAKPAKRSNDEKAAEKAAKATERAAERAAKAAEQAAERRARTEERTANRIRNAYTAAYTGISKKALTLFGGDMRRALDFTLLSKGASALRGIFTGAVQGLVHGLAGAVRESMKLESIAKRIAINNRGPGGALADSTALRKEFENTAISNKGLTGSQVAAGVGAAAEKGGSLEAARRFQDVIAKTASATGKDTEEIGAAVGKLFKRFQIKDVDDMGEAIANVVYSSRKAGVSALKTTRAAVVAWCEMEPPVPADLLQRLRAMLPTAGAPTTTVTQLAHTALRTLEASLAAIEVARAAMAPSSPRSSSTPSPTTPSPATAGDPRP